MNRWEQEFQHLTLEEQRKVLEAIRNTYEQAARDCQNRIAQLNARTDMQNLQSIIYRRQYQEAILNQINETLADLNATNYETIHDYVEQCYVNGYIGAMYDLSQQGIPIITPIDQRDVFRATVTDSRLSEGLYSALGEDVNELKDAVRRELSRGIAQGSSWVDVARNLSTHMVNSPFRTAMNNSMRIARTEGHRVQMQGSMDALHVAKDKGADVLKQWDAALDANTRTSHQHVDGEIREVDEKFSNGLMFPSDPKGSAAEVINCRCALLHRARWALDESELETLKKRAEYFDLDKTDNFNDFKKKYLRITDEIVPDEVTKETSPQSIKKTTTVVESVDDVDNSAEIQEAINGQAELLKQYGSLTNIMLNGSDDDMSKWNELRKISNMDERSVLKELMKNPSEWENVLAIQNENTMKPFINQLLDVATDEELGSLNTWTSSTFANINKYLRWGVPVDEISMNAARNIEAVLDKVQTTEEIIVRRGTGTRHIFENVVGDWNSNPSLLIGHEFTDGGFVATSPMSSGGFGGVGSNQAELFIRLPVGTHGAYIAQQSNVELEQEFLIQRNYSYRIVNAEYRSNPIFPDEQDLKVWCEVILNE